MKKLLIALIVLFISCASAEGILSASGSHALYADENGCVWGWGSNQKGESDPEDSSERVLIPVKVADDAVQVACGRQFSCVLSKNGSLRVFGKINAEVDGVKQVSACEELFAYVTESGSAYLHMDGETLLLSESAVSTACGSDFVMYLTESGEAYLYDGEARLLMGNVSYVAANGQTGMLISEGEMYVFGASGNEGRLGIDTTDWIDTPAKNGVKCISAIPGVSFSGALDDDGNLTLWGMVYSYLTAFDENGDPLAALADGSLINYGKTPIQLFPNVKAAAIGDAFIVVVYNDGSVFAWGSNDQGQCGDGYYTKCSAEPDDEEEENWTIVLEENQQRVFPVYVKTGK